MKVARNLVLKPIPIALPGRSIHLTKVGSEGSEAPLSDVEAQEGTVDGLIRVKHIKVRDATAQDRANYPNFSETPNAELLAVHRRRQQLVNAKIRAAGGIA